MSSTPSRFTKEIIVLVQVRDFDRCLPYLLNMCPQFQAKPGSEDRLLELSAAVNKAANSDEEPGCLTFRIVRSGSHFVTFEKSVTVFS